MARRPLDIWADPVSMAKIRRRFSYAFGPAPVSTDREDWYRPVLTPHEYEGPFRIGAIGFTPFGRVVAQSPEPGAEIEPGLTCLLTLGREGQP